MRRKTNYYFIAAIKMLIGLGFIHATLQNSSMHDMDSQREVIVKYYYSAKGGINLPYAIPNASARSAMKGSDDVVME